MYNNIVIYIVGHGAEDNMSPNEMHIFQCVNVSARDVVEDLKAFKQGRYRYYHVPKTKRGLIMRFEIVTTRLSERVSEIFQKFLHLTIQTMVCRFHNI